MARGPARSALSIFQARDIDSHVKDARIKQVARMFCDYSDEWGNGASGVVKGPRETWPAVAEKYFKKLNHGSKLDSFHLEEFSRTPDGTKKAVDAFTARIRTDPLR